MLKSTAMPGVFRLAAVPTQRLIAIAHISARFALKIRGDSIGPDHALKDIQLCYPLLKYVVYPQITQIFADIAEVSAGF